MRNRRSRYKLIALLAATGLVSCASVPVPSNWLSEPEDISADVFGAWIGIEYNGGKTWGEFIALENDTLFLADSLLRTFAVTDIVSARLVRYHASDWGGYVLLGTLSTAANGKLLIFTAPLWFIGGSIAANNRSYEPILDYPEKPMSAFTPYARFPQGMPSGIDQGRIVMKPPLK